ncbi:hypothetical protein FDECE_3711 [Fusarium decemcellulare]|nr:hypothetical protein FDECE_3711 [Fusarium decemcellulare]
MMSFNLVQVDPGSFAKKRKPSSKACVRCHERKVKCNPGTFDSDNGEDDNLRLFADGSNSSTHRVASPVFNATPIGSLARTSTDQTYQTYTDDQAVIDGSEGLRRMELAGDAPTVPGLAHYDETSHQDTAPSSALIQPPPLNNQALANTSVAPPMPMDRFEAYVEDSLGSYAPSFAQQQHHNQAPNNSDQTTSLWQSHGLPHREPSGHPHPLQVNMSSRSTLDLEHQVAKLDSADMEYLKGKGAFDLPSRKLQEDLVEAYFLDVHPTAPVINRHEFLSAFHGGGNPSRLLLFAIFTSGSRACRNPALLDSKGTNQGSAQRFYRATKALLDTGYEQSRLVRVQALLLLTWWWDKKDDGGRNMRSCAVDAINTAQSMGMHRWGHYPKDDLVLARLWKRVWWTCFNRDVAVAASHGLPCIISISDFDVHPLTEDDFNEEPNTAEHLRRHPYEPVEVAFSMEITRIAEALHHIHQAHFVKQHLQKPMTGSIAEREANLASLRAGGQEPMSSGLEMMKIRSPDDYNDKGIPLCRDWLGRVPQVLKYEMDDIQKHEFWPAFAHILFFTNIMLRFRQGAVSRPTHGRAEAERLYCQARGIAAATVISKILRNVRAYNQVLRFTGQLTMSLFNCLIFFLIEGQSPNDQVRRDAQAKYSMCLHMLYEFSQLWVSASLVHRLFEALQANMQLSRGADSSFFHPDQLQSPLPGLRISSDITTSYMRHLLATGFYYNGNSVAGLSLGQSSTGPGTDFSSPSGLTQYFLDGTCQSSPGFSLPLEGGVPDSLDVDQWVNFFGLGGSPIDETTALQVTS